MIGKTILHYRIIEKLGEGGMGVVYLAEDTKLERKVAIKFLPRHIAASKEDRQRFETEAKAAAALNHPNIATIYAIEEHEDEIFIVMEYIEGQELRAIVGAKHSGQAFASKQDDVARNASPLRDTPLPVDQIINIATQIAEGLEAAHKKGIVHRDIKSSNIMVTGKGQVKITDFGLARIGGDSETVTTGTTLGTMAYMSPEQVNGEEVGHRSDIWSFGIVLYEMISGQLPFQGDYSQAIYYAILNEEPAPLSGFRPGVPEGLENLVKRTLSKDPQKRFQQAEELLKALQLLMVKEQAEFQPVPQIILRQITFSPNLEEYPAFSPDGKNLLYCREDGGFKHIFLKSLENDTEIRLTDEERDDIQPAWSRDGEKILFVRSNQANGKLEPLDVFGIQEGGDIWVMELKSKKRRKIMDNAFGPTFSPDGKRIAFDASWAGTRRIWTADVLGRNREQISFNTSEAVYHTFPCWSPDGLRIVFQNIEKTRFDIKMVEIHSKKTTWVTNDLFQDINPVWSPCGKYIYFSSFRGGGMNIWRIPVSPEGEPSGRPQQITTGAGQDVQLALSPDGRRLAFSILNINADLWRLKVSPQSGEPQGKPQPLIVTTREESRGAWSPDGVKIAFNSDRNGDMNIWVYSLKDKKLQQITRGKGGDYQPNWSPDGKKLAFFSSRTGSMEICVVELARREPRQLTQNTALNFNPFFSPDGRFIAYQSDQDNRLEVWVMDADGKRPRPLTNTGVGGHFMRWSLDGKHIIYSPPPLPGPKRELLKVPLDGGEPEPFATVMGGSHISFSPDQSMILDVVGHKTLWVTDTKIGGSRKILEFEDPGIRIDYPVWSPAGDWVLFDRLKPQGGNIWCIENLR